MKKKDIADTTVPASNGEEVNRLAGEFPSAEAPNSYRPEDLWIDPSEFQKGGAVKKLLTTIKLRKPNKHEFFRVSPKPEFWRSVALMEFSRDDTYLVHPRIAPHLDPADFYLAFLCLTVSRQGIPFFWNLKVPSDERRNAWTDSAITIAKIAIDKWVKIRSRQEDGRGQGFYEAEESLATIPDPVWPDLSVSELYEIAFKGGRIIDTFEHAALKKLTGEIQ
jgi:hypothetical protein